MSLKGLQFRNYVATDRGYAIDGAGNGGSRTFLANVYEGKDRWREKRRRRRRHGFVAYANTQDERKPFCDQIKEKNS